MHRVVHLDAFPTMIVVVFVKHEVHCGPTCGEKRVVTLLVRHVHQLVYLAPVVPFKAPVELWVAFQRRILVHERSIRNAWPAYATERHVIIRFVSRVESLSTSNVVNASLSTPERFVMPLSSAGTGSSQRIAISLAPSLSKS